MKEDSGRETDTGSHRRVSVLLLDFDGPVCAVFNGKPASTIAAALCRTLEDAGLKDGYEAADPLQVLRSCPAGHFSEVADRWLTLAETDAIRSALPTSGLKDVLGCAESLGIPVAIVSNNSTAAIQAYLRLARLSSFIRATFGRPFAEPRLMKPSPFLLNTALAKFGAEASSALFVGDSASDGEAAAAAGVPFVGYANRRAKAATLRAAGASLVLESMRAVVPILSGK